MMLSQVFSEAGIPAAAANCQDIKHLEKVAVGDLR